MVEENIIQELKSKSKNRVGKRNYFHEEIKQNWLMSKRHKKFCPTLKFVPQFLTLASEITGCFQFLLLLLWLVSM